MWGHRIVMAENLKPIILRELHASHFGVTRMKEWARSFVWWPLIDSIESITKKIVKSVSRCEGKKDGRPV